MTALETYRAAQKHAHDNPHDKAAKLALIEAAIDLAAESPAAGPSGSYDDREAARIDVADLWAAEPTDYLDDFETKVSAPTSDIDRFAASYAAALGEEAETTKATISSALALVATFAKVAIAGGL
jgi:hypothetical protein